MERRGMSCEGERLGCVGHVPLVLRVVDLTCSCSLALRLLRGLCCLPGVSVYLCVCMCVHTHAHACRTQKPLVYKRFLFHMAEPGLLASTWLPGRLLSLLFLGTQDSHFHSEFIAGYRRRVCVHGCVPCANAYMCQVCAPMCAWRDVLPLCRPE